MSTLRLLSSSRKRRVRKKHKIGEFTRYGADVCLVVSTEDENRTWEQYIEIVESFDLTSGGGSTRKPEGYTIRMYVTHPKRVVSKAEIDELRAKLFAELPGIQPAPLSSVDYVRERRES
jgi:uncharacterized protein YggL (DUF469 family)